MAVSEFLAFFVPWEFSWLVQISVWGALLLYFNGLRKTPAGELPGYAPIIGFVLGVVLMYLVTQTRFDYWSQYMFFVHRGQHLVLHHLAPFLIALAMPAPVLARGLPAGVREWFARQAWLRAAWVPIYRWLQQPAIACILFVGLIAFWLTPEIHFDAMLNVTLYWVMNWSMALDGLLFWWLMFERGRGGITPRLGYGTRVLLLFAVMVPQIIIGASITFADANWFEVYAVCGRAWPLDPMTDQHIGGLITWIPAAMMSVIGALVILRFWIYDDAARNAARPAAARA
ncbi:cytochrome c oxidase assembly protein [Wenzhouxiangella sediminis]|uniref:Cytochrome c oxidase assembly protein n=1 Tax=Wenzhouxiangella sediminis TaxID=1792836 RepID=A0A3E1K7G5_9GAMM|nr:cytochrome c oxidase assembly protein [Wenzhouxiangella sediminis]